jgi:endonuclease III
MTPLSSAGVLSRTASGRPEPRVRRTSIGSYEELGPAAREEHIAWRARAIAQLPPNGGWTKAARASPSTAVDKLSADLVGIGARLAETYGTPDLGNKADSVDELVYIILARRTREGAYQAAYRALESGYASWEELAATPSDEIVEVLRFSGLANRKAQSLKLALGTLIDRFGRCTLEPTRSWTDDETMAFLCSLPEIGPKSAACVMVCSLDRPAFAVDAHVGRVLERMQVFRTVGIDLVGTDHKAKQLLLWDAVPPALRYTLHVNLLVHGRTTCMSQKPRCGSCAIAGSCASRQVV